MTVLLDKDGKPVVTPINSTEKNKTLSSVKVAERSVFLAYLNTKKKDCRFVGGSPLGLVFQITS